MRFFIFLFAMLFTTSSCSKKSSVRKPATEASLNGEAAVTVPSTATPTAGAGKFDGDLTQVRKDIDGTPLGDIIAGNELVTGVNSDELQDDQVLVEEDGDIVFPNPPEGISLADTDEDVDVEVIKNDDGSQEIIIKDAETGKVIAKETISSNGTTIIQIEYDPETNKPASETTINLDETRVDDNGNALITSQVVKIFFPDGTILSETHYGEDGNIDRVIYHNAEGDKIREEILSEDGITLLSETVYNDDGTRVIKTWNQETGQQTVVTYDAEGNIISEVSEELVEAETPVSAIIDQSSQFVNKISGFYKTTTWNVKKLGDSSDGESCDSCERKRQVPLQPYQEQILVERNENGVVIRDETGAPQFKSSQPAYCGLTKVLFNDVHGDTEHTGCGIGKYKTNNTETDIETRNANAAYNGLYALEAWKNNDSDAYCEAMCWQLETSIKPFASSVEVENNNKEKIIDDPDGRKFCFLDKVQFTNLDKSDGPGSCRVYKDEADKAWYVESKTLKSAKAVCRPGCFDIGEGYVAVDVEEIVAARANGGADRSEYEKHIIAAAGASNMTYQSGEPEGTNALSTVCGLTGVLMADIDDGKEVFNCKLTGGNYQQEQTWKDFIQNNESIGIDELADKKLKWTLWAGLNGGDDDETHDPLSADGKVNDGLVQGNYNDKDQDQYGECHAICFQIKHDCDGDGKADKELHEVCPLQ